MSRRESGSRRPWKFGRFKENSRCIRCGKRLEVVAKICDSCVVEMHVESILTDTPLVQITERYDIYYTTVLHKLRILKSNGKYQELFFRAVEKFRPLLSSADTTNKGTP